MSVAFKNVSFAYGATKVLDSVTWRLPDQGVVCLWGASGCGKTTVLRLLAGLEKPDGGEVSGVGRVAMVFQADRLLPWRTALVIPSCMTRYSVSSSSEARFSSPASWQ